MTDYFSRQAGVTLIELMTTVALVAILIALTVPSFKRQIEASSQKSVMASFITGMAYARSESVKRGIEVHLRSVSADNDWTRGWCVTAANDCGGDIVKHFGPTGAVKVTGENAATRAFTFNAQGHLQSTPGHVSLCSDEKTGKKIAVTLLGQALAQPCNCNGSGQCE